MAWKETCCVKERTRFVLAHEGGLYAMKELCERFGISRKTGYKWLERFRSGGILMDRPSDHLLSP